MNNASFTQNHTETLWAALEIKPTFRYICLIYEVIFLPSEDGCNSSSCNNEYFTYSKSQQ